MEQVYTTGAQVDKTTWVEIVVLNETLSLVKEILPDDAQISTSSTLSSFYFDEVNTGFIEEQYQLTDLGIAYNYAWGTGHNYNPGFKYIRFTPEGALQHIEYYENELNPPLEKLLELVSKPKKLAEYVQQYSDDITPLPWDNQVEYGKIFRARQLLLQNS